MSRTGIFFVTAIAATVMAMIQLMIYRRSLSFEVVGLATALLVVGWILVGLAYLLSGRRWTRETVMKAVLVMMIVCAALATFERLSH